MPAVSILMATYNWSTVLPYSIGSVLGQTFEDFELLVIGDGCTDDSAEVVDRIEDPRVSWFNLPQNMGHQTYPNNEGLRRANGKYIAYLGHDDLWLPQHLEVMVAAMNEGNADLVHGMTAMIRPDDSFGEVIPADRTQMAPGWLPPGAVIHDRDIALKIGGWRDYRRLRINPEQDFYERIEGAGGRLRFIERMTLLKFPTAWRKNAYRERPSAQQAGWLKRVQTEPDLERTLLAEALATPRVQNFGERAWIKAGELKFRLRNAPQLLRGAHDIDFKRRFKGLPKNR